MLLRSSMTALAFFGLFFWVTAASAQTDEGVAGTVATFEGTVDIRHDGEWAAAAIGAPIHVGDQVRTGTPGRARLVFEDESVVNVGDGTLITIDTAVFSREEGTFEFLLELLVGKVRALVSEYYKDPASTYQVQTATAVSAVRGTEFVVSYDAASETSEVLGLEDTVAVHGVIDTKNNGVLITRLLLTEVPKGKHPTPPRLIALDSDDYRRLLNGLQFVGGGQPESMVRRDPSIQEEASASPSSDKAAEAWADVPPAVDVTPDPVERTPAEVVDQPSGAVSQSGSGEVDF